MSSDMMVQHMVQSELISSLPRILPESKNNSANKNAFGSMLKDDKGDNVMQSINSDHIRIFKDDCSLMDAPVASINSPIIDLRSSGIHATSCKQEESEANKTSVGFLSELETHIIDHIIIDLLDDEIFSVMAAHFINDQLAGLSGLIEMRNFDLEPVHTQFISDPIFIDNIYSSSQLVQTQRGKIPNDEEDQWEREIEAQVAQILNDSIHTVYAIRTHFKAVHEFVKLVIHHFEFVDFVPLINLLNTGQKLKASDYFKQIMAESFDSKKFQELFSSQLLNHLPMEKEFEVIESRIMVS